jgi:predicted amino acid dehydrogenase
VNRGEVPTFVALGHQESWDQVRAVVEGLRPADSVELDIEDLRSLVKWIPPRTLSRFDVGSGSTRARGIFVDTFISPDELAGGANRQVIAKVRDALKVAEREDVALVTLGGFTSIMLEADRLAGSSTIPLTTGNTLTAALIVRGVERAVRLLGRDLRSEHVLILGATGDVGSACARWLSGRAGKLLLGARNAQRLRREAIALAAASPIEWSTDISALARKATVVIAAASMSGATFKLEECDDQVIVCDAGYPKNVAARRGQRLFLGGMGTIDGGFPSRDGMLERFYRFPVADVAHGCILEGAVLALAGRFEPFSQGRGFITAERIEVMWSLATAHGVRLAPLFDAGAVWPEELATI